MCNVGGILDTSRGQLLVRSMLSRGRVGITDKHHLAIVVRVRHKSNEDLYLRLSILSKRGDCIVVAIFLDPLNPLDSSQVLPC